MTGKVYVHVSGDTVRLWVVNERGCEEGGRRHVVKIGPYSCMNDVQSLFSDLQDQCEARGFQLTYGKPDFSDEE